MTNTEASLAAANALEEAIDRKIAKAAAKRTRTTARVERIAPDGTVWVVVDGSDTETPASNTAASVAPGDMVNVTVTGGRLTVDGNTTDPSAGVVRVRRVEIVADEAAETAGNAVRGAAAASQAALNAQRTADEAQAVAEATDQHFWSDTDGIHVTDVTQDAWGDSTSQDYHAGHNILLNSLGILLRTALRNLVSITKSAIAFFDGEGNSEANIVASFGAGGAQIGKSDENHLTLGEDNLSIVNQDGATMFDVDMDAGTLYTAVSTDKKIQHKTSELTEAGSASLFGTAEVSDDMVIDSGDTFTINPQKLFELDISVESYLASTPPTISSASGLTAETFRKIRGGIAVFNNSSDIAFTYGTASSVSLSAAGTWNASGYSCSFDLSIVIAYSGGTTKNFSVTTGLSVSVTSVSGYIRFACSRYLPSARYVTQTVGASLAFGTRQDGSTNGLISSSFGEGLIASSERQSVFGAFNVEDANDTYALIIGNGTADNERSNALAVKWDGAAIMQAWAGVIQMFAGSTPPAGWLLCDGSAVSRTDYATLFAAIGTTWGVGDGSTTFNLPDLRGRAPIGAGAGSGLTARTLGGKLGSEYIQAHTHGFTQPTITSKYKNDGTTGGSARRYVQDGTSSSTTLATASGGAVGAVSGATTGSAGNMQPSAVVNFIIHTGKF